MQEFDGRSKKGVDLEPVSEQEELRHVQLGKRDDHGAKSSGILSRKTHEKDLEFSGKQDDAKLSEISANLDVILREACENLRKQPKVVMSQGSFAFVVDARNGKVGVEKLNDIFKKTEALAESEESFRLVFGLTDHAATGRFYKIFEKSLSEDWRVKKPNN